MKENIIENQQAQMLKIWWKRLTKVVLCIINKPVKRYKKRRLT